MRFRVNPRLAILFAGCGVLALYPALAQRGPQSILPPGFGEPETPSSAPTEPRGGDRPVEETPPQARDVQATPPASANGTAADIVDVATPDGAVGGDNTLADLPVQQDLPPQARRSLDRVGLLAPADGGFGADAFGAADGRFLATLMDRTTAPIASRWASILLRRALLSQSAIPAGIDGADWVAHRAWLLVRMGEADNARALVQRVDSDNYTPWLREVAMQAALASADPAALCGIADDGDSESEKPSWTLARAMCSGLSGEGATASSLVSQARASRKAGGVDVLLAEKVVGAGTNTRRAINIQWDGVDRLTAWRFGLATATGVAIPPALYATAGPQVQAWAAQAPLLDADARTGFADRAAALGVFSSAALVDLYGSVYDAADPADRSGTTAANLRAAFSGDTAARLAALNTLWAASGNGNRDYARLILTARAAAMIPADAALRQGDLDRMIAAMMSAGLDLQAARWTQSSESGSLAWALLAVGAPRMTVAVGDSALTAFGDGNELRRQLLFAGLAGLGRLSGSDADALGQSLGVNLRSQSSWTRALDRAVLQRQRGTVALLAAIGLQTTAWTYVPPSHLYRIVDALRRVGFEPEARMIAAEAVARS